MLKTQYYFLLCLTLFLFNSCETEQKKPVDSPTTNTPTPNQLNGNYAKSKSHHAKFADLHPSEFFEIQTERDTILVGETGTLFFIPKNNFLDANGKEIKGSVKVEWQEIHDLNDAMNNNLSTMDEKGNYMETGGMFYLDVSKEGVQQISMKEGIRVEYNNPIFNPQSKHYEGVWQGDQMVWAKEKELEKGMTLISLEALEALLENSGAKRLGSLMDYDQPQKLLIQDDGSRPNYDQTGCTITKILSLLKNPVYTQEFSKTWIFTREFSNRIIMLDKACAYDAFELYLQYIELNLWEADSLVAKALEEDGKKQAENFKKLSQYKHSKAIGGRTLSKELVNKIEAAGKKNRARKNARKATQSLFNYPESLMITTMGYQNLDVIISYPKNPEDKLTNCQWSIRLENQPPQADIKLYALFKGGRTILTIADSLKTSDNQYVQSLAWAARGRAILFVARDKENKFVGCTELIQTTEEIEGTVTIEDGAAAKYKKLIQSYTETFTKLDQNYLKYYNYKECCGELEKMVIIGDSIANE